MLRCSPCSLFSFVSKLTAWASSLGVIALISSCALVGVILCIFSIMTPFMSSVSRMSAMKYPSGLCNSLFSNVCPLASKNLSALVSL